MRPFSLVVLVSALAYALPLRDTRITTVGVHAIDETLLVSINIDEVRRRDSIDGEESVLAEKSTGLVVEYSLLIDEHGISVNGETIRPTDSHKFTTLSAKLRRLHDQGSHPDEQAIISFANAQVTAEVSVRILDAPRRESRQRQYQKQLLVSTRIIDVLGSRVQAEEVLQIFPLRSTKKRCTTIACSMRQMFGLCRKGRKSDGRSSSGGTASKSGKDQARISGLSGQIPHREIARPKGASASSLDGPRVRHQLCQVTRLATCVFYIILGLIAGSLLAEMILFLFDYPWQAKEAAIPELFACQSVDVKKRDQRALSVTDVEVDEDPVPAYEEEHSPIYHS